MTQTPNNNQHDDETEKQDALNAVDRSQPEQDVSEPEEKLILPASDLSHQEAASMIRDAAGQLNDFLADRRRESEEFARRMTRLEEEVQNNGNSNRHVMTLSVVVALIAFAATTGLWRLARNQSEVESALQQTMTQVKASSEANLKRISEVQGAVAAGVEVQAATALRLEKQLSGQLDDQRESATRLEKRLGEATRSVAEVREDVAEKLAVQSEITKVERARLIKEIKTVIGVLEASLEERSKDLAAQSQALKSQQKEFSQATARAQADRQAMVRAATETVNAQLLGLQEMLDSLEEVQPTDPQAVSKVKKDAEDRGTAKTKVGKTEIASAPSVKKIDGKAGSKSSTTKSTRAKAKGDDVDKKGSEGVDQSDEVTVEKIKANEKKSTDSVVKNESEKSAGTQEKKETEKK
ncbi:MAG: hypothetical protein VYA49_04630 [Planctomycetota bacterium]|nr:hypothetical protein [Planctomycetaceae bacterium]MEE2796649.1 hypothetical protein [Planctomycetota bacterium]